MKKINNVLLCIIIVIFTMTTGCGSKNNSDNKAVVVNSEGQVTSEALSKSDIDISSQTFDEKDSTGENESTFSENSTNEENINDANVNGDNINNPAEISLVMVGDVLLHTPVSDSGLMEDGSYNYSHLFKNVKNDIESADIALVNQEVILGGTELGLSGYPAFNGAYEVGDAIVEAGFDVVLHATNHALDKGRKGILNCINYWKNSHPDIGVIGINESQEEQNNIYIKEIDGMRIAILNYTYETNEQKKWAEYFTELGANLIIGTHPHVIEPVKWVESSNGNKALVYYSIGNFINATSDYGRGVADRMIGAMANVRIARDADGNIYIKDYSASPLVTHMLSGKGQITTYKLSDYSEELAAQNEIKGRDSVFSLQYCKELCDNVFGDVKH